MLWPAVCLLEPAAAWRWLALPWLLLRLLPTLLLLLLLLLRALPLWHLLSAGSATVACSPPVTHVPSSQNCVAAGVVVACAGGGPRCRMRALWSRLAALRDW